MNKRKPWTAKDLAHVRELCSWWTWAELAALLGRTPGGVRWKAKAMGLSVSKEEAKRRRKNGLHKVLADPVKSAIRSRKLSLGHTPERRAKHARIMREVIRPNHWRSQGKRKPETTERIARALRRHWDRTIGVPLGHPLRAEYDRLIHVKLLPAAEARRIIRDEIERLPKHERQIIKLQLGQAKIVR